MNMWNRIVKYGVVALSLVAFSAQAQQQGGNRQGRQRMNPEERAKIQKAAAPITAEAIAKYVELSEEKTKSFVKAYVAATEAANKRMADLRQGGQGGQFDREGMMEAMNKSREEMDKALKDNMTEEQAKKAALVTGRFNSLGRNIEGLLQAKVEEAKIKKAAPVLIKYAVKNGEMMAKMREEGANMDRNEMMSKMRTMREELVKELTPIVGEEAATGMGRGGMWMGMGGGMGMGRNRGQGGGNN